MNIKTLVIVSFFLTPIILNAQKKEGSIVLKNGTSIEGVFKVKTRVVTLFQKDGETSKKQNFDFKDIKQLNLIDELGKSEKI